MNRGCESSAVVIVITNITKAKSHMTSKLKSMLLKRDKWRINFWVDI